MHAYLFIAAIIPKAFDIQEGKSQDESQLSSVFSSVVGRPVPEHPGAEPKSFYAPAGAPGQYASAPHPGPNQKLTFEDIPRNIDTGHT